MIHILLTSDARCVLGAAASMRSIVDHADATVHLRFHLMTDGVSSRDVNRLMSVARDAGNRVEVAHLTFDRTRVSHLTRSKLITKMGYARLLLGEALPEGVERCIYVDSDVAFRADIAELWRTPLGGRTVGAVPNGSLDDSRDHQLRLGLDEARYLNSGVLLIDVARWRARNVGSRSIAFAERIGDRLILHDQDALNGALQGDWTDLPWHWNVWVIEPRLHEDSCAVFHYMGAPKPWHADYDGRFLAHFRQALDRTPFRGTRPWNPAGIGAFLSRSRRRMPYLPGVVRMMRLGFRSR